MANKQETLSFQTEVKQILNLVVHSLYSNKEIFLRELISNASDALDKLRFLALSHADLYEDDSNLFIRVEFNETLKTLTITDNGIGMDRDEAIHNLGTIAHSGTKEFLSQLTADTAKDSQLIGQFGVGFYSAFIVAKKVTVKSRRAGSSAEEGIIWESMGEGDFTIDAITKKTRGTEITLYLKSEEEEFLSDWRLKSLIRKYSDHICWPIEMQKTQEFSEDKDKEAVDAPIEFETINKATAVWTLQKSEISDEDYKALYKHISHDYQDPLLWSHNHVEGKQQYISLLYIPAHAPFDLWQQEVKHGLKLYVKRVFIMDDATQFLPRYLRFVKGVIDASDLPLNVSREILQDNKLVDAIRAACTKRVLSMIDKMQDTDKYQEFWDEFGLVIKEGTIEDYSNREAINKLLRFSSTHGESDKQSVSLSDYVKRMQEGQEKIYYMTASSHNAAKNSPHLEIFKKRKIEVLLLSDKVDQWLVNHISEFEGKKLQSISKGKLDLEDDEIKNEEQAKSLLPMLEQIQTILGERIKEARITHRLTDSPSCVVADEQDMSFEMQRILQSAGQKVPEIKPIFEINPENPLIQRLHDITDDAKFELWVTVLFEQALLAEGGQLDNPADFVGRMNKLLTEA